MENKSLYSLISNNIQLRFVDPYTGSTLDLNELGSMAQVPDPGGLALLYLDNGIVGISILLSFLRLEWTVAVLNPAMDDDFKAKIEGDYLPDYIVDPSRDAISGYYRNWTGYFKKKVPVDYPIDPRIKLLLATSGSTGSPKFVKLSEKNLLANARSILAYLPIVKQDTVPLNLPIYYAYGLSVLLTNAIAGGKIVCTKESIMGREFWEQWEKYKFTSLAGVPYSYEMLLRIGFVQKKLSGLRYFTQAGGKLHRDPWKKLSSFARDKGVDFFVMYGQTEATARMAYLDPTKLEEKVGSIGKPIREGVFELEDGELIYSGPNVGGGYADSWEDLQTYDVQDRLYTGDIACKDEEGYYYIVGRKKRFAKLFGNRINLDEVEELINANFAGIRNACIHTEDTRLDVIIENQKVDQQQLIEFLAAKLKLHKRVVKVHCIHQIPVNANGKTNYWAFGDLLLDK